MNIQKYFAIGDLHGHYDELMLLYEKLLEEANLNPTQDVLVFLGDFVDGGPGANKVIGHMINWEKQYPHWKFLLGNHDDIMIDWIEKGGKYQSSPGWDIWLSQGGRATIQSYFPEQNFEGRSPLLMHDFAKKINKEHLDWLKGLPLYFDTEEYFFVHAGLLPGLNIEEHKKALEGEKAEDINEQMLWIREQFIDSTYDWGKKIIFGHTANPTGPIIKKNKIGIDTLPRHEGFLTAVELPAEKFYYQNAIHEQNY